MTKSADAIHDGDLWEGIADNETQNTKSDLDEPEDVGESGAQFNETSQWASMTKSADAIHVHTKSFRFSTGSKSPKPSSVAQYSQRMNNK